MSAPSPNYAIVQKMIEQHRAISTVDISLLTGIEMKVMQRLLSRLAEDDKIHRQRKAVRINGRWESTIWAPGPDLGTLQGEGAGWVPTRAVVKEWVPCCRRDPLVAALFGAAMEAI